jgi:hypothetical protein
MLSRKTPLDIPRGDGVKYQKRFQRLAKYMRTSDVLQQIRMCMDLARLADDQVLQGNHCFSLTASRARR